MKYKITNIEKWKPMGKDSRFDVYEGICDFYENNSETFIYFHSSTRTSHYIIHTLRYEGIYITDTLK